MKKNRLFILMCALAAIITAAACGTEEPVDDGEGKENQQQQQQKPALSPGDYKFVASGVVGTWKDGDKIYVHGAHGLKSEVLTVHESNLSREGKVATLSLDKVTTSFLKPDGLYAAYPADAAEQYVGSLQTGARFLSVDGPRCVAYLSGDTFSFVDVTSVLNFTVSGDYDRFAICANNRAGLRGQIPTADVTSAASTFTVSEGDGYPFLYGDVPSDGKCSIWFPAGLKFTDGYTIFLSKNDKWDRIYRTSASLTISGEQAIDLGAIELSGYDGRVPVMPSITGEPWKKSFVFGELSDVCLSADGDFLWGIDDDGYIGKISFDGQVTDYHYAIADPEDISLDPRNGNLLIGMEVPGAVGVIEAPVTASSRGEKLFDISLFSSYGNDGLEGLTYYKDNMVFAGSQSGPNLVLYDLNGTLLWNMTLPYKKPVSEIAGLCYDPLTNWLWIIDSEAKKVFVYVVDAEKESETKWNVSLDYLGAYPVSAPGNPEGVCVDHKHSCLWVTDDYSRSASTIYRYDMEGLDDFNID